MWEEGWPLMLMMLPLFGHVWAWACGGGAGNFGKDWEHVGRGLGADAHDASLVWACLGVGVCGGGGGGCVWVVTREKGGPLMLTMLVYCRRIHVGRGLAADAHDASLVWACLGEGVCVCGGLWVVTREKGWPLMLTMLVYRGKDWDTCGKRAGR